VARSRPTAETPPSLLDDALLRRLEGLRLRARRLSGGAIGGRPGRLRTPAADFIDHRPYTPGDDRRYVDWSALARHDALYVKVGRRPRATAVEILLDVSASMDVPPGKLLRARRLAAALGWLSLVAGDRLTMRQFPAPDAAALWGPATGPGAAPAFLAAAGAARGPSGLESALAPATTAVARAAPAGGLAVVVSDLWLVDDLEDAFAALPAPRWDVVVLHVLARPEMEPELGGAVEIVDAEGAGAIELVVDQDVREAYRAGVRARVERVRRAAGRHGAAYAFLPSEWPLERAVLPFLRRRALLD